MAAFGAIAIVVLAFIAVLFEGILEHCFRLPYLHAYFGQVAYFQRRTILVNQVFQVHPIEAQISIFYFKILLGKIKGLIDQVCVGVLHQVGNASVHFWRGRLFKIANKSNVLHHLLDQTKKPERNRFPSGF
jgi:hypothetical protein